MVQKRKVGQEVTLGIVFPFSSPLMRYRPGLPQKLIGGWTDEVGPGSRSGYRGQTDPEYDERAARYALDPGFDARSA